MAKTTSTSDAAQMIIDTEIANITTLLDAVKVFDGQLEAILDGIDYPENFPSDSRRITKDIRSMLSMRLYDLPNILRGLKGEDAAPVATPMTPPATPVASPPEA